METFYKGYTKVVHNRSYYFIKKYLSFPEYEDVEDILKGYGMHTDFNKACSIAGLDNLRIKKQLLDEIQAAVPQAKVIELKPVEMVLTKKIVP